MPRRSKKKQRTVLDQLIHSLGTLDALRTATFVTAWDIADNRRSTDGPVAGPMRMEDYASYWRCSIATVSRDMARFRSAFPMWERPTALIEYMQARGQEPGLKSFDRVAWEPETVETPAAEG